MTVSAPRVIAFGASLRAESYNKKLARTLAKGAADAGAEVRYLDLAEFPIPVYNADIYDAASADPHALFDRGEKVGGPHRTPMPEGLLRLKEHVRWSTGWLIATPEHKSHLPGRLPQPGRLADPAGPRGEPAGQLHLQGHRGGLRRLRRRWGLGDPRYTPDR
jgi:NAD(P)H-dependent FMN reductase